MLPKEVVLKERRVALWIQLSVVYMVPGRVLSLVLWLIWAEGLEQLWLSGVLVPTAPSVAQATYI